jgi:hypothetical protein
MYPRLSIALFLTANMYDVLTSLCFDMPFKYVEVERAAALTLLKSLCAELMKE